MLAGEVQRREVARAYSLVKTSERSWTSTGRFWRSLYVGRMTLYLSPFDDFAIFELSGRVCDPGDDGVKIGKSSRDLELVVLRRGREPYLTSGVPRCSCK
jgi:hypothetical protein